MILSLARLHTSNMQVIKFGEDMVSERQMYSSLINGVSGTHKWAMSLWTYSPLQLIWTQMNILWISNTVVLKVFLFLLLTRDNKLHKQDSLFTERQILGPVSESIKSNFIYYQNGTKIAKLDNPDQTVLITVSYVWKIVGLVMKLQHS